MARSRRRKKYFDSNDNESHERWLVSYADFITLLFAFFVVMYSISSVNNEKYEHLSEALDEAFSANHKAQTVIDPIQIGVEPKSIEPIIDGKPIIEEVIKQKQLSEEILRERQQLQLISEQFEDVMQPYIESELIEVKRNDFWIELEMNSQLLFLSGEAELASKATPVIRKIAEVVRRMKNVIRIEGHTDSISIDTLEFPSNWDLSSARATTVVREFVKNGISAKRLSAVGYGEFHPVADNNSEEGRIKNRRVVLVLMSQAFARYGMRDKERSKVLNLNTSVETIQKKSVATNVH